jgi:hypothetical protein
MKKWFLFTLANFIIFSAAMAENVETVGDYRIKCYTSYPKTSAGLGSMTKSVIEDQIQAGFPNIISTTATKVGWSDVQSDHGEVAVCVTAKK